ncbi:Polycomb protein eed-A [Stylophora pistillata]|uniref:Polycomb protein eed-A n=1 Tax=Stylophora pistillata TaxID=50429 RepID=A0A2B4T083_STYPI|nr:Polycomb protein eed-A [Stylophora pistillata]
MTEETPSSLQTEDPVDAEGTGSDVELERGGKQAKLDEEDSDNDSTVSSSNSNSTQAAILKRGFRGKGRKKKSLAFKCANFLREDHKQPIFAIQFNHNVPEGTDDLNMFATVGSNRSNKHELYQDDLTDKLHSRFAQKIVGKGVAHTQHYIGHGGAINELKCHPVEPYLLLSASKDHSLRLWNIKTDVLVAIFGGVDGHRDEVLSTDFDILGEKMVSCGMDHSLKIWSLQTDAVKKAIAESHLYDQSKTEKAFHTVKLHYPDFTTRDIHRNYVDSVRFFGDLILSKSCENCIVCWKPQERFEDIFNGPFNSDRVVTVLHRFEFSQCDIWYMRFSLDYEQRLMAVGNQTGKTFVWDIGVDDPTKARSTTLVHNKCVSAIRQTGFSKDGKILISVCDDERNIEVKLKRFNVKSNRAISPFAFLRKLFAALFQQETETKFTSDELGKLAECQLNALKESLRNLISEKTKELQQEQLAYIKEGQALLGSKQKAKDLETEAWVTLRPNVNKHPFSDDLTRVLMF